VPRFRFIDDNAMSKRRCLYIIAGPNGAGKTTFAEKFFEMESRNIQFINADFIARGLHLQAPEKAALRAGRLMLEQIRKCAEEKKDFAFETTLSGKIYLHRLRRIKKMGYEIHLIFLWLPTMEMSIQRVADRVKKGGHDIPEKVVRRRFAAGIRNLFDLYDPLLDSWVLFDNSDAKPIKIAIKEAGELLVLQQDVFEKVKQML